MKNSMRAVWLAGGLLFCGCGSSPSTAYYTLAAVSGTIRPAALGPVEVRRPRVAGYLDRTAILAQWDGLRLELANNAGWGEPITAMIGRVLAENLSERLPGTIVLDTASELSIPAAMVVELAIRKFDFGSDGYVHLNVLWSVRGAGEPSTGALELQARPAATDTGAVVAAMSSLLGQLADEIAKTLLARAGGAVNQAPSAELRE